MLHTATRVDWSCSLGFIPGTTLEPAVKRQVTGSASAVEVRSHYLFTLGPEAVVNERESGSCMSVFAAGEIEICAHADKIRRHRDDIPKDHGS